MSSTEYVPARGDLVWVDFNPQTGHEQAGRRPAITISPVDYNRRTGLALFCPITNQAKGYPFEVPIPIGSAVTGVILVDQMKSFDWRQRRASHAGMLDEEIILEVVNHFLPLIDPDCVFSGTDENS